MFITFEGPDGCGKSSVIKVIKEKLEKDNYDVVVTREPGGSPIAEQIRKVILDVNNNGMDYMTECMLYAACRAQHLKDIVIPSLKENKIVICDRFVDSSYVYQGVVRGLGMDRVIKINELVVKDHMPDLTICIDLESEKCLERINKNNREKDRLDNEGLEFHKKVRNTYLELCEMFKDRIVKINGDQTLENVANDAYKVITNFLNNKKEN